MSLGRGLVEEGCPQVWGLAMEDEERK
jgi:hypothetical protein